MTILYILHQTILMGGGTKSFMVMLRGLMQRGIHPIVAMPDHNGVYSEIESMNIPTIVVTYRDSTYPWVHSFNDVILFLPRIIMHRIFNFIAVSKIAKTAAKYGIDIVHTNVSVCSIGFRVSRKLNVPHIYHIREYADKDFGLYYIPTRNIYLRQLTARNSYNICITKDIQKYFRQEHSKTSRVVYNGIQKAINTFPFNTKEDFFLYAGRVIAAKGVLEMIEAYNEYRKCAQNIYPLYIVGEQSDLSYYTKLINYINAHGMNENVVFFGQREDIQNFMKRARAIIIPSHYEGFGRCMPEAMFYGCLAIGHDTGGTHEQLDNGYELTGGEIALRYETNKQLAHHLLDVSNHSCDFYSPMIERAFITVNTLYSSESNINKVFEFYEQILA